MNRTIVVPQIDGDGRDSSYCVTVSYDDAVRLGAERIGAAKVGRHYYYYAEEAGDTFRVTGRELAQLGAGQIDSRGCDYSLWCTTTGRLIRRPSRPVREALGMEDI